MARLVRWLFAVSACAGLASVLPLHAQPENALPPAVEPSPLLQEPETPEAMFDAVMLLVDLARFDLAKLYLQQFLESQPSDDLLLSLRDRYGTGEFLRLSRIPELKELGTPLLEQLNEVSRRQAEDAAFVDGLIQKLSGPATDRELATRELRNAGVRAVPQMLRQLATAESGAQRDAIVLALSRMGEPAQPVLIAALDAANERVRLGSLEAITLMEAGAAVPRLWALAYGDNVDPATRDAARRAIAKIRYGREDRVDRMSDVQATEELRQRAEALFRQQTAVPIDESGSVTHWTWNDAEQTAIATEMTPEVASRQEALRLSRDAFELDSERPQVQTLYLATLLASEVHRVGWDQVLSPESNAAMQLAVASGIGPLTEVLRLSLESRRADAAWAALQGLSSLASPELVRSAHGRPSSVVAALNYPDPRVQVAAAIVILRADPRFDFSGASRVTEVLRRALTDPGQARAIVIDPDREESTLLGTYMADEGFVPIQAATGRDGFTKAAELTGVNLIVVQVNVADWGLTQTLANLRADSRTAFLPIIVYGPEEVRNKTARLVSRTGNALFVGESPAAQSFWLQARDFLNEGRTPPISAQQRDDFRALAAYWLASIASGPASRVFDVSHAENELLPLVQDPGVAANALLALGRIGSASVQSRLGEFALNDRLESEVRQRAAAQLAAHIHRFGLLLSTDEVQALTAGWEQEANPDIQAALAAVVGSFKPNTGLVSERLRRLSAPTAP